MVIGGDLHSNTSNDIRRIPERELAGIFATRWRIPWHDKTVDINQDREHDSDIPGAEVRTRQSRLLAFIAHEVQADSQREKEGLRGIDGEVDDEVEGITGGRCEDHDHRQAPLDGVWADGSPEWTR
jgi:hypothetical protein